MKYLIYRDDSLVYDLHLLKVYSDQPGVEIVISEVEP